MYKLQLLALLFLFQFSNLKAQLSFSSPEEVSQYLAGDWLLEGECDGDSEVSCDAVNYPLPTLSYHTHISFEEISNMTDRIIYRRYDNNVLTLEQLLDISLVNDPNFEIWQLDPLNFPYGIVLSIKSQYPSTQDTLFFHQDCTNCIVGIFRRFDSTANEELSLEKNIKIFPNPCKETLNITSQATVDKVVIYDISAKKILTKYNIDKTINTSELDSGMYFIEIHTEDKIQKSRFVKT